MAVALTTAFSAVPLPMGDTPDADSPTFESSEMGIAREDWEEVFGVAEPTSRDRITAVLSGQDHLTIMSARAENGYAWHALVDIPLYESDTDLWVSNQCVTSSGRYMVVVFGPRGITNDEQQFGAGASAAIVDLTTGDVRALGVGFSIAYYNPGCGEDDLVALTGRDVATDRTMLAVVDATSGVVISKLGMSGRFTSATVQSDGTILAAGADGIVAIAAGGDVSTLVETQGTTYDLTVDLSGSLAYVVATGATTAKAYVLGLAGDAKPREVARGAITELGWQAREGGGLFLLGEDLKATLEGMPGVVAVPSARPRDSISSEGVLVVQSVKPAGIARVDGEDVVGEARPEIAAVAAATGKAISFTLDPSAIRPGAPLPSSEDSVQRSAKSPTTNLVPPRRVEVAPVSIELLSSGSPHDPVEAERYCSVPRNDASNQAYQPKPRQVEWAVDRAVKGELTEARPSNWRSLGMPGYSPQALFPPVALAGGGTIPPQVVLGVLMQESNMWQASRYTSPGNTGNPLIGDFYGNRGQPTIWDIDFPDADCGYGVGQITDGMRLAGHERPGETALPYNQQRAIALDYEANIAMTVRMLGLKWNELAAAGMEINNGGASNLENWFFAAWTYNTGFHPYVSSSAPWGVGWYNNPVNDEYPASRLPFLEYDQADAAHPQDWPYPEKVMGWAAWGTSLVETAWSDSSSRTYETSLKPSFVTAWWNTTGLRTTVKPPRAQFCDLAQNDCDPNDPQPCQLSSYECWWHVDASWKNCPYDCGKGFERFPSSYSTEASSMSPSLPALTLQSSFLPNCGAPPTGVVVVDDTTHDDARLAECTHQSTTGSFQFTFAAADAAGSYPAKVDLHQQGGGYNGHFYFAHMQDSASSSALVTGTWTAPQSMANQWVRVWVHLPDYAAWTQQAPYTVNLGNGTSSIRYVAQRRYENEWVSLGVFQMHGIPSVSLSNVLTRDLNPDQFPGVSPGQMSGVTLEGVDDVAWDAVGFEALPSKPDQFVVALGDSYSSGEGAGDYEPWSDNNGTDISARNSCHVSEDAWIQKTVLPGETSPIGALSESADANLDFHFLACSGAETENLLPYYSTTGTAPTNGEGEDGRYGQWGGMSQLDMGYLDENTTLVTLSIGGNDMKFAPILQACVVAYFFSLDGDCSDETLDGDVDDILEASADRFDTILPASLDAVLTAVRSRAPNAAIALVGYPQIFEGGTQCVNIAEVNRDWLNDFSVELNDTLSAAANAANVSGQPPVFFVDPQPEFSGHNLCNTSPTVGINWLTPVLTPGESSALIPYDWGFDINGTLASQESVHPNDLGTDLYSDALEDALDDNL